MRSLRVAMAQINTTVGDLDANTSKILSSMEQARRLGVDLIAFPEMALTGYPPEDLLLKPQFIEQNQAKLREIVAHSAEITAVVGFVDAQDDIYNAAAIVSDGKLAGVYHKIYLPNYGVFDENRYFQEGREHQVYVVRGVGVGVNICEDIWYEAGPTTVQASSGAEVIVNINASPYHMGKRDFKEKMLSTRASDNLVIVAYINLVGGQDELVFDGNSMIFSEKGQLIARGKLFQEDLVVVDLDVEGIFRTRLHDPRRRKEALNLQTEMDHAPKIVVSQEPAPASKPPLPSAGSPAILYKGLPGELYDALVLGTGDYVRKNGFKKVVIGLSGGIDSSLVATVAVDALGADNVIGVSMPSKFSSRGSRADARRLAKNLGIKLMTIPINSVLRSYLRTLSGPFAATERGTTEENIQARIRGNLLMALSNKFGWLVLTTGNKSEYATGYTTLYGDMAGGFAVIKDVPKTMVYQLAKFRNLAAGFHLIPTSVLTKEPSAELKPNQRDSDTLPPYPLLDPILTAYVEEDKSVGQIISMGFDQQVVRKAAKLVDGSEYKRRQSPPGVKITPRAFGRDRRLPITNHFKDP